MTIRVIHSFESNFDDEFKQVVLDKLNLLINKTTQMANEITILEGEVAETKTVMESAVVLLTGLNDRLKEAGTDKVKLAAITSDLDTHTNTLATAVAANTPAENEPPV